MKHTKGEWWYEHQTLKNKYGTEYFRINSELSDDNGIDEFIHVYGITKEETEANAKLIVEAGNVANESGLTPRQLLEQRNEMLEALEWFVKRCEAEEVRSKKTYARFKEIIEKATK